MSCFHRLSKVSVLAPLLWARLALGTVNDGPLEDAVLHQYQAPADCPDAASFMSYFASRTHRVRLVSSSPAAVYAFIVTLSHEDGRIVGRLEIHSRDSGVSHREVSGQHCTEVVAALSFVAALTADPTAQSRDATSLSPSDAGSSSPQRLENRAPAANSRVRTAESPAVGPEQAPPTRRAEARTKGWQWEILGHFGALGALFPSASPYAAASLQFDLPQGGWDAPSVRLGGIGALSHDYPIDPGYARFRWLAAQLGICPVTLRFSDQWSMIPCAIGELGVLRGIGGGVTEPGERSRPWRAAGASLELRWMPGGHFFVHADGSVRFPFSHDEFVMVNEGKDVPILKVRPAAGTVGLGIGLLL